MKELKPGIENKPKYSYLARRPCGCMCAVVVDCADKDTANVVARWIRQGFSVERVTSEWVSQNLDFTEKHGPAQPTLFTV